MRTNRRVAVGAVALALMLILGACGSGDGSDGEPIDGPQIKVGAQDFGESAILASLYGQALEAEGYDVVIQPLGGYRDIVLASFESEDINFTPEYAASMLEFLNGFAGEATGDADATTEKLRGYLADIGLQAFDPSEAVDTNAFVIKPGTSETLGITTLSDLASKGADLTLGGPPDCETNPFCIPGLQSAYGLDLSGNFTPLDAGAITVQAFEADEIDVALLFSTSGIIADRGWVLLEDDQNMLAADNVVPVLSDAIADAYGSDLQDLVDRISAAISTADLTEMNRQFDIEQLDAEDIALDFLVENGFVDA
ncbi:MAG: ABC transporter substrate-binding protein [Acidimicrobiia bacterium]|nr:ABC transporter substrate-binding protein [Acidimicrobiia bacterium]